MAQEADSFYLLKMILEVFYGLDNNGDTLQEIELEYQLTNNMIQYEF